MHELAVAQEIVRAVLSVAASRGATAVRSVDVDIGELEGLQAETLREAFHVEATGTPVEGASLNVTVLRAAAICPNGHPQPDVGLPHDPGHGALRPRCALCSFDLEVQGARGFIVRHAAIVLSEP